MDAGIATAGTVDDMDLDDTIARLERHRERRVEAVAVFIDDHSWHAMVVVAAVVAVSVGLVGWKLAAICVSCYVAAVIAYSAARGSRHRRPADLPRLTGGSADELTAAIRNAWRHCDGRVAVAAVARRWGYPYDMWAVIEPALERRDYDLLVAYLQANDVAPYAELLGDDDTYRLHRHLALNPYAAVAAAAGIRAAGADTAAVAFALVDNWDGSVDELITFATEIARHQAVA